MVQDQTQEGRYGREALEGVGAPHAWLASLSEEHGWIVIPGGALFDVGDRVRIVPNHACVSVATQSMLYVVDGDEVVEERPVVAR